jgi:hypothetical protein
MKLEPGSLNRRPFASALDEFFTHGSHKARRDASEFGDNRQVPVSG